MVHVSCTDPIYKHACELFNYFRTMVGAVVFLMLLPAWVACAGEGNIRLLEDEVLVSLKACSFPNDNKSKEANNNSGGQRWRRSDDANDGSPRIDDNTKQMNHYNHERRTSNNTSRDQIQVINGTDYDYDSYANGEKLLTSAPRTIYNNNTTYPNRAKRSEPLFNKPDNDQCLSQCVFANLQVVDARGIPREAELWNKVQSTVTSQQSRSALRDQIRACFQELQSEAEDNGCSYSNKLERCLMLRFADRRIDGDTNSQKSDNP